jgi:hypothetical protein
MARAGLGRHRAGEKGGNNGSRFVTSGMRVNNRKSFIDKSEKIYPSGLFPFALSKSIDSWHLHFKFVPFGLDFSFGTTNLVVKSQPNSP